MLLPLFLMLLLVLFVVWLLSRTSDREKLVALIDFNADNSLNIGLSIVADRVGSISEICDLMSYEPTTYEVVVVMDFSRQEELLQSALSYFGLLKVNYISVNPLSDSVVVGVYRSHLRLYKRLLLIDARPSRGFSALRIGALMCSDNYVLHFSTRRTLRVDAIKHLLLEIALRPVGSFDALLSRRGESIALYRREVVEDKAFDARRIHCRRQGMIGFKLLK